jgi:DNA-binding CsgD family transcriptional regulator
MLRTKNIYLIATLFLIVLPTCYDFFHELHETDHSWTDAGIEIVTMSLALLGILFLIRELYQHRQESERLNNQLRLTRHDLQAARTDLHDLNLKIQQASRQYAEIIQEQFDVWEFTPSEKEVALLLLKGLSFDEIASVRDTREKTVRQQATAIYRKSGLNGRHEFAAWFFEDFLA